MIRIQNLSFAYGAYEVFKDLNLTLKPVPTAIIGQNGAGKTTLVKLLKGLLKPSSGEILLNDMAINTMSIKALAGEVGLVFQNPNDQIFKPTVIEEVIFGPKCMGQSQDEARESATLALEQVGLLHCATLNPHDLSLSEKKFVALASVLAMHPKWLILDEPTIAQDAAGKRKLGQMIQALSAKGIGVTAILHDMDFAANYFEEIIVMCQGQILSQGPATTVFQDEAALRQAKVNAPIAYELSKQMGQASGAVTLNELIRHFG